MVEAMTRLMMTVKAERVGDWWLLTCADAPGAVSQVRRLADAEEHAREAIAFVLDVSEDSFEVAVVPELPAKVMREVRQARREVERLEQVQRRTAELSREAARHLVALGLTGADAAVVLKVSKQRVSQLIHS
jgi:predicted RNase H-like HicB family nuclease